MLQDTSGPTPHFVAFGDPGEKLGFELRVHDGTLLSPMSRVDITIDPGSGNGNGDDSGCSCKTTHAPRSSSLGTAALVGLALAFVRRRTRRR
jgi:MYXO-CTERM domain-containing protein